MSFQKSYESIPLMTIDTSKSYLAKIETDLGTIELKLFPEIAPQTVNNFVFLASEDFYVGSPFHRVIQDFMIQGGDPTGSGRGGPGYTIPDEFPTMSNPYKIGTIAMANTGRANSGGSQFFIVTGGAGVSLPPAYTVFGQVTSGMEVVSQISADGAPPFDPTGAGVPMIEHFIQSVKIEVS